MGNFNRDRKPNGFGGGRSGGKQFSGSRSGGFRGRSGGQNFGGGRDGGRPQMHQATCAECGDRCEVPFKPTGDKPVYCSNCFGHSPNYGSQRGREKRSFDRRESRETQMFSAICAECGDECEVPFKPSGEKPVLCSHCFSGGSKKESLSKLSQSHPGADDELKEEVKQLSIKIDKILTLLQRTSPVKEITVMKKAEETSLVEQEDVNKSTSTKLGAKKATDKKSSEKKPTKKVAKKTGGSKVASKKSMSKKK